MAPVGIIGYGEIGSAVAACYRRAQLPEPLILDPALGMTDALDDCDVVHVCVPAAAAKAVVLGWPSSRLWIVHSTVDVGTCRQLQRCVAGDVVHAPVRGIHPNLVEGLRTFTMPVGGPSVAAERAVLELGHAGIRATTFGVWEQTELAKLLCTLRYGVDILFMRHVAELCRRHSVSFDRVYTEWTKQYNDGYTTMGQWWFQRPILKPMVGRIGGHCVVPNAELLAKQSVWARLVAESGVDPWDPKATTAPPATKRRPRGRAAKS